MYVLQPLALKVRVEPPPHLTTIKNQLLTSIKNQVLAEKVSALVFINFKICNNGKEITRVNRQVC